MYVLKRDTDTLKVLKASKIEDLDIRLKEEVLINEEDSLQTLITKRDDIEKAINYYSFDNSHAEDIEDRLRLLKGIEIDYTGLEMSVLTVKDNELDFKETMKKVYADRDSKLNEEMQQITVLYESKIHDKKKKEIENMERILKEIGESKNIKQINTILKEDIIIEYYK